MPRKRIRKRTTQYEASRLLEFVQEVEDGKSIYAVAMEHNVPIETMRRWVVKPPSKIGSGGKTVLTLKEEQLIVCALEYVSKCGYPQDRNDVKDMVHHFLTSIGRTNPFKGDRPGDDWIRLFEMRHKDVVTKRKSELLTKARAEGLSSGVLNLFFNNYTHILESNGLMNEPARIFNLDETGLNTDPRSAKVFVGKHEKNTYVRAASCGKASYTVLVCVSANGTYLPPFIVYKGKNYYDTWMQGGPRGAAYGCSESGWMTAAIFESWFHKVFVPSVAELDKPVLLTFDGHNSHLTYTTAKEAMDNGIIIFCLPPNTSHALQPLDVGVFRGLKVTWREILKVWFRESRLQNVDKAVFPSLIRKLWYKLSPQHAIAGFSGSGLYPVNKEAVRHRVVASAADDSSDPDPPSQPPTPRKQLCRSILKVISPTASQETSDAQLNAKRKRKRVQATCGEVLTTEEVVKRLRLEEESRLAKASKASTSKPKRGRPKSVSKVSVVNVEISDSSASEGEDSVPIEWEIDDESITIGPTFKGKVLQEGKTYVVVNYEGALFPGLIMKLNKNSIDVKCMQICGPLWKWPERDDICSYPIEDIKQVIKEPTLQPSGGRLRYAVPELDSIWGKL